VLCRNDWFVFRETEDGAYREIRTFTACPQIYFTIRNKAETLFLCQRQILKLSSLSASPNCNRGSSAAVQNPSRFLTTLWKRRVAPPTRPICRMSARHGRPSAKFILLILIVKCSNSKIVPKQPCNAKKSLFPWSRRALADWCSFAGH
jgi:hypothetical protein